MPPEKKTHPPFKEINLPDLLYGLSDSARLKIARNLYESKKPLTCLEAVDGIKKLPISTRSHCFKVLRESGLIISKDEGRYCYSHLRIDEIERKFPGLIENVLKQKKEK